MHPYWRCCLLGRHRYEHPQPWILEVKYHNYTSSSAWSLLIIVGRSWKTDFCQPELLRGTLRQNLDPFSQHDDSVLNDALRAAGLFSLQSDSDEARLTLDSVISGGGSNLSVGQRQILALARAMVRQSKLLILDEGSHMIDTHGHPANLNVENTLATSAIGRWRQRRSLISPISNFCPS